MLYLEMEGVEMWKIRILGRRAKYAFEEQGDWWIIAFALAFILVTYMLASRLEIPGWRRADTPTVNIR